MIRRELEKILLSLLSSRSEHPNVVLVEGARQVGKSTLIEHCLQRFPERKQLRLNLETDHAYAVDLINRLSSFEAFTDYLEDEFHFVPGNGAILFIDEVQECRRIGQFIRSMKEQWTYTQVVLSGSTLQRLFEEGVRYPVGRVTHVHVQPFSFKEFLVAFEDESLIRTIETCSPEQVLSSERHERLLERMQRYFMIGGLPAVVMTAREKGDWTAVRRDLYQSYRRDFIKVFNEDTWSLVDRAMRAVANYVGGPSKDSHVVKSNGPGYRHVPQIFSTLEAWHLVLKAVQEAAQPDAAAHVAPKRYFFDLGLLHDLRLQAIPDISIADTLRGDLREPLGGILENAVAFALVAQNLPLIGWRSGAGGSEVDFIIKEGRIAIPMECKASLKLKFPHLSSLKTYLAHYGQDQGFLVNFAPLERLVTPEGYTIHSLPVYLVSEWKRFV